MDFWRLLPSETVLNAVRIRGGAFRAPIRGADGKKKNRYLFVLNREPSADEFLVLVTATTRIAARERARLREKHVLVHLGPDTYSPLEQESVVDCGSVVPMKTSRLVELVERRQVQPLDALPREILNRLVSALAASRTVSPRHKRLVLGEEEGI